MHRPVLSPSGLIDKNETPKEENPLFLVDMIKYRVE